MKIFINLGLPKTSSTNLQTNFYPNLPKLNYLDVTILENHKYSLFK